MDLLFFTALGAFITSCLAIYFAPSVAVPALVVLAVAVAVLLYSLWSDA